MLIHHFLRQATALLTDAGCPSPETDAEYLMRHTLGLSRLDLYLNTSRFLTPVEIQQCETILHLRASRFPLQYILGETEFMSLPFLVNPSLLIPRPETEILVEAVINDFKRRNFLCPVIADIGTGSGAIAVAVAHSIPQTVVYTVDTSDAALRLARTNAERNGVTGRVFFLKGNLTDPFYPGKLDAIISNPPYIPTDDISNLPPEVRDYEPREALDGGPDGLCYYRRLIPDAIELLHQGGILGLEVGGEEQAKEVSKMIEETGVFQKVEIIKDLNGIDRVVIAQRSTSLNHLAASSGGVGLI